MPGGRGGQARPGGRHPPFVWLTEPRHKFSGVGDPFGTSDTPPADFLEKNGHGQNAQKITGPGGAYRHWRPQLGGLKPRPYPLSHPTPRFLKGPWTGGNVGIYLYNYYVNYRVVPSTYSYSLRVRRVRRVVPL